ncbi:MAG: CDGSH iron-sulfur domain-containing protein [Syntrophomonadaceae bacterium]|jgi:CDGSH-type Zn-finger protein|nr:CDGSH iron-sulfur domain-containing protein [Syntrophomonadaceae bacterium]
MAESRVQILSKGPVIVAGHVDVVDDNGKSIRRQEPMAICRCGQSQNMPFCDGISEGHMKVCSRAEGIL